MENEVYCADAQKTAELLSGHEVHVAYLDPPYNQHPYSSNYHVLNSVALWDKPPLSKTITPRTKSAIRLDWRTERRSAYNYSGDASKAYCQLIKTLNARYILTSYSTDGTVPVEDLLSANSARGQVRLEMCGYKRYRVSSQRFSKKPMNVEFIVVLDTHKKSDASVDELTSAIRSKEAKVLNNHPENAVSAQSQLVLFEERKEYGKKIPAKTDARRNGHKHDLAKTGNGSDSRSRKSHRPPHGKIRKKNIARTSG